MIVMLGKRNSDRLDIVTCYRLNFKRCEMSHCITVFRKKNSHGGVLIQTGTVAWRRGVNPGHVVH